MTLWLQLLLLMMMTMMMMMLVVVMMMMMMVSDTTIAIHHTSLTLITRHMSVSYVHNFLGFRSADDPPPLPPPLVFIG